MKKFLSIIFICFLALGFYGCGGDDEDVVDPLVTERITTATVEINSFVEALDEELYTEENWALISDKLVEVKGQIATSKTVDDIDALIAAAKTYIEAVEKLSPLDLKKDEYIKKLDTLLSLYDEEFYSETAWAGMEDVIANAKVEVASATTEEALENIYRQTRNTLDGTVTYDEEVMQAITEAIIKLDLEFKKYDATLYHADDYANLRSIYDVAKLDMLALSKLDKVEEYLNKAIEDMAAIKKLVSITYNNIEDITLPDETELLVSYRPGTTYIIPVPTKKYQEFLGWYMTSDFSGDAVTAITTADANIILYAKWDELTDEDYLNMYIDQKEVEITEYLATSKDKTKYNSTVWESVLTALETAITNIKAVTLGEGTTALATAKGEVDDAFAAGKLALDAIEATNFTVTFDLDGGNWKVTNKDELKEAFFADFNSIHSFPMTVNVENFNGLSYGYIDLFFEKYPDWKWLVTYLSTICDEAYTESIQISGYSPRFRVEVAGYFSNGIVTGTNGYESTDYSAYANDLGFVEYLKNTTIEYVEETTLPIPVKVDYKFIGWYTNSDFTGVPVTTASAAITLYAKFEELTPEEKLQLYQNKLMAELEEYALTTRDKNLFTEDDWNLFLGKVAELQNTIDGATSNADADTALTEAKEEVDNYPDSTYTVTYELNGGNWTYANKTELVTAFVADFKAFMEAKLGRTVNLEASNFFSVSWGYANNFFKENTEWQWFIEYLKTKCAPGVANQLRLDYGDGYLPQLRIEIHAYINNKFYSFGGYDSADYSGTTNDLGFLEYFKEKEFGYLGPQTELPTPMNGDKVFAGWYDNAELTGEAVTTISGETTLYAKWEDAPAA